MVCILAELPTELQYCKVNIKLEKLNYKYYKNYNIHFYFIFIYIYI